MAEILLILQWLSKMGKSKNAVLTQSRRLGVSAGLKYILKFKEEFSNGLEGIHLQ